MGEAPAQLPVSLGPGPERRGVFAGKRHVSGNGLGEDFPAAIPMIRTLPLHRRQNQHVFKRERMDVETDHRQSRAPATICSNVSDVK